MSEVTRILSAIEQGDPHAAAQLLPLVYDELRRLAAAQMAREKPGQTLDATALVHEAYLRLVGDQRFENRRHFFAAAAEAMRRILVENARRKKRLKRGGGRQRCELQEDHRIGLPPDDRLLDLDEALGQLAEAQPELAELVKLRYFAQLTVEQSAELLGLSPRTVKRNWVYASAWLRRAMGRESAE
jgi:RNA polymerase sigma factor (TIGR02999 family)